MLRTDIFMLTLCTLLTLSTARQIRISRYNVQVEEDEQPEINATVREVTSYPAAGYRPGRAFEFPNNDEVEEQQQITTTTIGYDLTTTTTEEEEEEIAAETVTGYPARGYMPRVAFNLPTKEEQENNKELACNKTWQKIDATAEENVTPYPAAGYRPCQPFILPTELLQQQQQGEVEESTKATEDENINKNPACGVSLNPLAPKPPAGSVDEPDAESVPVTTNTGNGNSNVAIVASVANPAFVYSAALRGPQPIIWQQPLTVVPQQPFLYTAHLQTRRW